MQRTEELNFGRLLRDFRRAAGLTQEELAERAGMSVRGLGDVERGVSQSPHRATVVQLADALEVSPEDRAALLAASHRASSPLPYHPTEIASFVPRPLTPLVGREQELVDVVEMLEKGVSRLITLTGPGGVGKTRLALEVAAGVQGRLFDVVSFVSLSPLRDTSLLVSTVTRALGLQEGSDKTAISNLVAHLREERLLLVLDNLEHLAGAGGLLAQILAACPNLQVLVTSRETLHLHGEQEYPILPLDTPDPRYAPPLDRLLLYPAVELFAQRARAVQPDFRVNDTNAVTVADICYRLDGLPLAIELAAAQIKLFPPHALAQRISHGLAQLPAGAKDLPPRQQTLRRTIDWSYYLLSSDDRTLLARMSVFAGGCSLEAAEAVCNPEGDLDLLQGLASLVDKSLMRQRGDREPRFRMLETIREFAEERLKERGEFERFRRHHAAYYLSLAEEAGPELNGPEQREWLDRLELEHDNLRAALRTARIIDDVELEARLAAALSPFWSAHNHLEEAQVRLDELLMHSELAHLSPAVRASVLLATGTFVAIRGDNVRSVEFLGQALETARRSGNDRLVAAALLGLGETERGRGNYRLAEPLLDESVSIYRKLGDLPGLCAVLSARAGVARYQGEFERARSLFREALALARNIGDTRRVADTLARLGNMASERGRPSESFPLFEEALNLHRSLGDRFGVADVLYRWGEAVAALGDYAGAIERYAESLDLYRSIGTRYGVAYVVLNQSEAAIGLGNLEQAEELAMQSLNLFSEIDDRRCMAMALLLLGDAASGHKEYQRARELYLESLSLNVALNTRPGVCQCLERLACLAAAVGRPEQAARLGGAASALLDSMDATMPPSQLGRFERSMAAVGGKMGHEPFAATFAAGRSMSPENIVAYGQDIGS